MPVVSSDTLQLAIVEEVSPGVTPANPAFQLFRTSGESLSFAPNTSESTEIGSGGRSAKPANVTGVTVSGSLNFVLSRYPALEMAIASVLASEWGECPLTGAAGGAIDSADRITVGNITKTFTIEKRFPDPATPGGYLYQWYKGVIFNQLTLSIAPNAEITGTLNVIGGQPELGNTAIAGATYTPAGNSAIFTAPKVVDLGVGQSVGLGGACWTSLNIDINSNNRAIQCIGTLGDKEVVLGTLSASISGDVYFASQDILQALLDNQSIGDGWVTMSNSDGDVYRLDFFQLKPVDGSLAAGGRNQDLVIPLSLQPDLAVICSGGGEDWLASLIFSKVNTRPNITVTYSDGVGTVTVDITAPAAPTITFVGTATRDERLNIYARPTTAAGPGNVVFLGTADINNGDDVTAIAAAVAAAVTATAVPTVSAGAAAGVVTLTPNAPATGFAEVFVSRA